MKTFYLLIVSFVFICFESTAQTWQWTKPEVNPDANSQNYAHDVEVDSSGNAYVLGSYWDSLYLGGNFIANGYGSYLAKYNPAGTLLWYKLITSPDVTGPAISVSDMVVNANGIFITGRYTPTRYNDYDCDTHIFSGTYLHYQIGNFNFTSNYNDLGFFLTKLNTNGTVVWNKLGTYNVCAGVAGAGAFNTNPNITSDKNGNITASLLIGNDDSYPAHLTSIFVGGDSIPIQSGYVMSQLVVVRYNSAGTFKMSAHTSYSSTPQVGGTSYQMVTDCNSMAADNNGNIFLYGIANDSTYFGSKLFRTSTPPSEDGYYYPATFIAKFSSKGECIFVKELYNGYSNALGGNISSTGNPDLLAIDNNNNVYALVNAGGTIILGDTIEHGGNFLVKMTNNGNLVWDKFFGLPTEPYCGSICYYNNNLYINGSIRSSNNFLSYLFSDLYVQFYSIYNYGSFQSFVAKADLNGNYQWVTGVGGNDNVWGWGVKAYQDNIYTCGYYNYDITTLGNLNTPSPTAAYSIFFGKLKDQYIRVGAIKPTILIPGCTINIPFTSTNLSFSATNTFTAELSDVNGDFTTVTPIGNVISTGNGTITAIIPASISYGSGYRIRIRSSDTLATGFNYYAYADTGYALTLTCPAPSSGFSTTNITANSATINWGKIDCASGYRIQYKIKGTNTWIVAGTLTNNNVSSFNLTGLNANTTYQWRVATRCKSNNTFVFSAYAAAKQFTTLAAFTSTNNDNSSLATKITSASVYPNPANNNATVLFSSDLIGKYIIQLTDLTGKILQTKTIVSTHGENNVPVNLNNYSPGLYFINLIDNKQNKITLKLTKE